MRDPVSRRYRTQDGKSLIEVRVRSALQLFDARDPAPFRDRDLDDDFVEYVLTSAEELPHQIPKKILIHLETAPPADLGPEAIREAIRSFLAFQIELKRSQLSKLYKTARLFLGIGLVCLVLCLVLARLLESQLGHFGWALIAKEGLVIFGWVSMWKPFELVLFDWYPLYDRIQLLKRLHQSEIEIQVAPSSLSAT